MPAELQERVSAYAERREITRSEAVRALVEAGLAAEGQPE